MKTIKTTVIALVGPLLLFSACTQRILDFTLISSKNIDMTKASNFQKGKNRIEGKDMAHWIIIIPTRIVNVKEALDKAIESTPGCVALLDGVVYTKFWWIPYIYGREYAIVEGTPLIDPSLVKNDTEIPAYGKIELDNKGEIKSVTSITEGEYLATREKVVKDGAKTSFNLSHKAHPYPSSGQTSED